MKIDNPKINYTKVIGFAILPMLAAIGILTFLILNNTFDTVYGTRLRIFGIFLLAGGLVTLKRVQIKKTSNKNIKILEDDAIIIKNKYGAHRFDASNIKDFEYSLNQISEDNYEGNIYLVDQNDRKHLLLAFDTNNQKHVLYDLKWFVEFFIDHTKVDKDDLDRASAITLGIPLGKD